MVNGRRNQVIRIPIGWRNGRLPVREIVEEMRATGMSDLAFPLLREPRPRKDEAYAE